MRHFSPFQALTSSLKTILTTIFKTSLQNGQFKLHQSPLKGDEGATQGRQGLLQLPPICYHKNREWNFIFIITLFLLVRIKYTTLTYIHGADLIQL